MTQWARYFLKTSPRRPVVRNVTILFCCFFPVSQESFPDSCIDQLCLNYSNKTKSSALIHSFYFNRGLLKLQILWGRGRAVPLTTIATTIMHNHVQCCSQFVCLFQTTVVYSLSLAMQRHLVCSVLFMNIKEAMQEHLFIFSRTFLYVSQSQRAYTYSNEKECFSQR